MIVFSSYFRIQAHIHDITEAISISFYVSPSLTYSNPLLLSVSLTHTHTHTHTYTHTHTHTHIHTHTHPRATARVDLTPTTADGILNFNSLDSVLKLFHQAELLSTIENLVFDFVTWYVPDQYGHSNEGKYSKMKLSFYDIIIKVVVKLTFFIESACVCVLEVILKSANIGINYS